MTRIIPWKLPDVKGGSIGGYTPAGGDSTPDTLSARVDVTDLQFTNGGTLDGVFTFESVPASTTKDSPITGINACTMTGFQILDLTGVASIHLVITGSGTSVGLNSSYSTDDLVLNVNLDNLALSFVDGTMTVVNGWTSNLTSGGINFSSVIVNVYNGNGEIIQQEEVTYE